MSKARARSKSVNGRGLSRALGLSLARPGDPYVLANGEIILEEGRTASPSLSKTARDPKAFRSSKKRTIKELPAPVNMLNGIACVILYTLFGIGDRELANALNITTNQLKEIKISAAYSECFEMMFAEFINVNSDNVHSRIAAYGLNSVNNIIGMADGAKNEAVKLRANIDMADRGGFTKKENTVRLGLTDAFRIVVTDGDKVTDVSIGGLNGDAR